jgi:hypothetical protein
MAVNPDAGGGPETSVSTSRPVAVDVERLAIQDKSVSAGVEPVDTGRTTNATIPTRRASDPWGVTNVPV